jgi:uncharacterized protein (DUF305 family)
MKRAFALLVIPAAAAVSLAAGGSSRAATTPDHASMTMISATAGPTSAAQHNDADVRFVQMMIPHHQQATEMAKLAATRASLPQVKSLAAAIETAQGSQKETMTGWLKSWGATVPSAGPTGGVPIPGLQSDTAMKKLGTLSGTAFDKTFLQMMIKHHQGAVTMAETEQAQGQYPPAKNMAASIVTSQTAQITKMQDLLKGM